ncbi:MAG TPA: 3-deoxy-D-manno-octulosonic acid transferase [Terriglobales bacterium]|nr:3-deoxy-D-manno-octulosonic acid transferase [Terriglobales bacterium]
MCLLYSALLAAALLLGSPYWIFQMLRHGKYRRGLGGRFGVVPQRIRAEHKRSIWIHAVSVGEVLAVSELVRQLRSEYPEHRVVISTTTDTGQKLAASRFGAEHVFYFPFDLAFCVKPYFEALQPELVIVAETEFWPNFLRTAHQRGVRVAVVNARISDRSLPGYRRWRPLLTRVLRNVNLFLAQTPEDARRLSEVGAAVDRVHVGGNLKFDIAPPPAPAIVAQLRSALAASAAGPVLVCGSTVDGEEHLLIDAFESVLAHHPAAVMLLAPRHPERFPQVADQLQQSGLTFFKRSNWNGESLAGRMLLIDSIGELASLYALADIAFVGGSLVPRGGHSILEPAQYGVAILIGPHTENFRDIVELFRSHDAVRIVSPAELSRAITDLLANDNQRLALGRRALETLQSQRGATQFTMDQLRALLKRGVSEAHSA